jgi:uroporphyrinogen decarboxylase
MPARMTSRERLLAAIRHEEPDRVPVGPRVWVWLQEQYGSFAWPYEVRAGREFDFDPMIYLPGPYPNYVHQLQSSYEHLRGVQVDLHIERYPGYTVLKRTIHTPAGRLSDELVQPRPHTGYGADPNPHWTERLVKEPADLASLAFLLPEPEPQAYLDLVAIQGEIGERGLAHVYINSAIDHGGGWVLDLEDLMVASVQQPAFVRALFDIFHQHSLAQTRCALEAGMQAVFVPWYFASLSTGWSPRFYQSFILPLVREHVSLVHSLGGIYHYYDDGRCRTILPWLAEAGVDVVSTVPPPPIGDVDLAAAKQRVGDRLCLKGNIDIINVIKDGTPDLIDEQVRRAICDAAPGGGFILGTSDSIREAPPANVRAYFAAGRRYGNYAHLGCA